MVRAVSLIVLAALNSASSQQPEDFKFNDKDYELNSPPPEAYLDQTDRQIAASKQGTKERPFPCAYSKREGDVEVIASIPTDRCVKMSAAKRWTGLWRNDFEGSQFCEAPAKECTFHSPGDRVWLDFGEGVKVPLHQGHGGLYAVEFLGRRTLYRGMYGHMGMSQHEIIVDRMISMREVEAPPPPMTKEQAEALWKKCEAAGNCISWEKLEEMQRNKK